MDVPDDGAELAASLAGRLERLTFVDLPTDEVTARIIGTIVDWGRDQGWRVYRRAASVLPLPPPLDRQHSVVDVACARPVGRPLVVEVDHTDRRRTVEKLVAEAEAGRIAIWVRWGTGRFVTPPPPVHLVRCLVASHGGRAGQGRRHTRVPANDRPPPRHSGGGGGGTEPVALPIPLPPPDPPGPPGPPDPPGPPVREPGRTSAQGTAAPG